MAAGQTEVPVKQAVYVYNDLRANERSYPAPSGRWWRHNQLTERKQSSLCSPKHVTGIMGLFLFNLMTANRCCNYVMFMCLSVVCELLRVYLRERKQDRIYDWRLLFTTESTNLRLKAVIYDHEPVIWSSNRYMAMVLIHGKHDLYCTLCIVYVISLVYQNSIKD